MNEIKDIGGIVVFVSACMAVIAIIYAVYRMCFFDKE